MKMPDVEQTSYVSKSATDGDNQMEVYDGFSSLEDEGPVPPFNGITVPNGKMNGVAMHNGKRNSKEKEIDEEEEKGEEKSTEKVKKKSFAGFFTIFRNADSLDKLLMVVGVLMAMLHGCAMPNAVNMFGEIVNIFVADAKATKKMDEAIASNILNATWPPDYEELTDEIVSPCVRLTIWACVIVVAGSLHMFCWKTTSERQVSRLRSHLFGAILHQDCAWFDKRDTGALNVILTNDIVNVTKGMSDNVCLFIQNLTVFVVSFIMALERSWNLALAVIAVTPLIAGCILCAVIVTVKVTAKQVKAYEKAGGIANEVLSSIRTVAAFGGELKDAIRYQGYLAAARKVGILKGVLVGFSVGGMWFCIFAMVGVVNWYGTSLIEHDGTDSDLQGGDVIFVMMAVLTGSMSLGQSLPNLEGIATAGGSAEAIFEVIDTEPQIDSTSEEGVKPGQLNGNIVFEKVDFVYESRPEIKVLDKINIQMEVGTTVALVGPSGSGKSTICHLLLRLYDTTGGRLTVDGHDIKDINVKWLRQHIGVVSQEPVLFDGSISDNIRLGHEGATQADIEEAAKMSNAHNFIMKFPDKYETLVGQKGTQMSGGQKQRIAIARALISNPKILLLDEATSALDSESEALVQDALEKASKGRTTIVVAHRLSTVRNADVIHCMSNGRLVESGNHDELMTRQGLYYALVMSQQTKQKSGEDEDIDDVILDELSSPVTKFDEIALTKKVDEKEKPESETEHEEPEGSVFYRLLKLNSAEWPYLTVGCFAAVCAGAVAPAFAYAFSAMIENFAEEDRDDQMEYARYFSIGVICVAVLIGMAHGVQHWMFAVVGENLTVRLREVMFSTMVRQEIGWFDQPENKIGILTSRLAVDATIVRGVGGTQLGLIVLSASSVIVSLSIAFASSWQLTLVILLFMPLLLVAGFVHGRSMQGASQRDMVAAEQGGKIASEAISNIRTVAALTVEGHFEGKFNQFFNTFVRRQRKEAASGGFFFGFSQSVPQFCYVVAFYYGAHLVEDGKISFEEIFRVVLALIMCSITIGRATSFAPDASKARVAAINIFKLLDRKPTIDTCTEEGHIPTQCRGEVTLQDVEFTYPSRPDATILRGLTVTIKPGQRVALVGQSGCGKSTCVSLVERFYDSANGSVLVDGVNVQSLNVKWLRSQIALVSQEPILFNMTIYENIAYGDNSRTPSMDEVIDAAKKANIHNFIVSQPLGYDTNVGESGSQLSGGQKQRIAIARALLRNPRILLLDEATSALDTESEKLVQEALERAQESRTCIVIAHRLSTIRSADKIVVIQDGRVVEEGTHDELMAKESYYQRLVQTQVAC